MELEKRNFNISGCRNATKMMDKMSMCHMFSHFLFDAKFI